MFQATLSETLIAEDNEKSAHKTSRRSLCSNSSTATSAYNFESFNINKLANEQIIDYKKINFEIAHITRQNENTVIFTDHKNNLVNSLDLNSHSIKYFGSFEALKGIYAIAIDEINKFLFIGTCIPNKSIYMLDLNNNFNIVRTFGDGKILDPDSIEIDVTSNLLYVTTPENNELTVWNTENGKLINELELSTPSSIRVTDKYLFVASYTEGKLKLTYISMGLIYYFNCSNRRFWFKKTNWIQ